MRHTIAILLVGSVSAFPLPPAKARCLINVPPISYRRTSLIHHKSRHRPRPAFATDDALHVAQISWPSHRPFRPTSSKLRSLRRRLDTAEDKFDIHKISSALYLASTIQILSTGATNGFESIPESLEASTNVFMVTSIIQGVTSVDMALKYRQKDPIVRAGFINMAFNMISLGWARSHWFALPSSSYISRICKYYDATIACSCLWVHSIRDDVAPEARRA